MKKFIINFLKLTYLLLLVTLISCGTDHNPQPADRVESLSQADLAKDTIKHKIVINKLQEEWIGLDSITREWYIQFFKEKYLLSFEKQSRNYTKGNPIGGTNAENFTGLYSKSFEVANDPNTPLKLATTKSVFFTAGEILDFIDSLRVYGGCNKTNDELGLRLYFTKYPNNPGVYGKLANQNSILLRGVCNYEDIPHLSTERTTPGSVMHIVAYDFGDVCPPVCEKDQAPNRICSKGYYRKNANADFTCVDAEE